MKDGTSSLDAGGANSLQVATSIAVAENQLLARQTADELLALAANLHTNRPDADHGAETDEAAAAVLTGERNLLAAITGQLEELAHQQLDGMDAFNIALFGRTGAGKSSLLEALSAGDGGSVSPGESDWTTTIRPVIWQSCRVIDTPGIQGWGRTTARQELEERARHALVTADVVLLCFDTQHQQAGEFRKVADWIAEFRKPAIAVLNVRLPNWRFPTRVPRRAARQRLSQTVTEHAAHIREELAAIGLVNIPLVALHTQRAVFARASEPIRVPDVQLRSLHGLRAVIGAEQLLTWSNLPVLENLLTTAVRSGATQLRRGMLLHQLTRKLDQAGELLHTTVEAPARIAAEQSERGIEQMLAVLGAPEAYLEGAPPGTAESATTAAVEALAKRLRELENARGGGLDAPATGVAQRHAHNVVNAKLAPIRREAKELAEGLIDQAIRDRQQINRDEFHRRVFDTAKIERVTADVVEELTAYLQAKVGLAAEDVVADLRAVQPQSATVTGAAGRGYRWAGNGVGVGAAVGAGAVGVAFAAGVANLWNPAGWALMIGSIVAGLAGPPVRRWLRRRGIRRREEEFSRARAASRQAVADTFDTVRDEIIAWFEDAARQALTVRLAAVADQALLLREVAKAAVANREAVSEVADRIRLKIPSSNDPGAILREAVRACEADEPPAVFGRSVWLGESWCDDPTGLLDGPVPPIQQLRRQGRSAMGEQILERLGTVFAAVTVAPPPGTGQAWLAQLAQLLTGDRHAAPVLRDLYQLVADQRPRVLIYGDYNVGKSSFIKRLLVDDEQQLPDTLTVRGAPETAAVHIYPWADLLLIDTPGLQSGVPSHAELAQSQIADSALVIYVLGANAVVGDRGGLDLILRGDPVRGIVPKLDRTLFVVNRADELSINPFDDEEAFAQVVARKEGELRDALVATPELREAGVTIPAERILFVASDPGGQVADNRTATRADFDPFRHWDGMDEVRTMIDEFGPGLQVNSVDVSVLHGGLARLGALAAVTHNEAEALREQLTQLDRLRDDLDDALRASTLIEADSRTTLERIVTDALDQLVDAALQADEDPRRAILDRAVRFWEDDEVGQEVGQWADRTQRRVQEWLRDTSVVLQRRVHSHRFQRSLADVEGIVSVQFPEQSAQREMVGRSGSALARAIAVTERFRAAKVLRAGTEQAAHVLRSGFANSLRISQGGAHHRIVTMAKAFFIKNQAAANAARITRNATRANVVLQVVTSAAELALLIRDQKADRRKEVEFSAAIQALHEQAVDWARDVADADPALASMHDEHAALDEVLTATVADRSARQLAVDAIRDRLAFYDQAMDLGRSVLSAPAFGNTAESLDDEPQPE
ncbi:MAG: GTPase [Pseudonocardiaceae bacterium]